jgi:hypothetical protein
MSTIGTVFPFVRAFTSYLYSGSLTTEPTLVNQSFHGHPSLNGV